jgi:hypothetical protein
MQPLIASSECIRIEDEQWNKENIINNFGPYFYDNVKNNDVLCVGIIAGQTRYVRDLCLILFQMSLNRPDWVADQAAYNILMGTYPYKEVTTTKFATLKDAWTVNAHVTNKPDQMEQFGPYLLEERPYFNVSTGKVVNSKGKPFVIVHQYDRVPEWNKYILDKYGVVIDEKTNIGTAPKYITIKT